MFVRSVVRVFLNARKFSEVRYRQYSGFTRQFLNEHYTSSYVLSHKNHPKPQILPSCYAGSFHMPYTLKHIEERVLLVLKLYDKIDPNKITLNSHFFNDCGLDSLDHVEVIIAMEDEFDFEIAEEYQHRLMSPKDVVKYVADRFDVFE